MAGSVLVATEPWKKSFSGKISLTLNETPSLSNWLGMTRPTLALNVARTRTAILLLGKKRVGALILSPEIYQSQRQDSFVYVVSVWRKSQSPSPSNTGHNGLAIIEMKVSSANYFCANAWDSNFTPSQPVTIKLRMFWWSLFSGCANTSSR